MDLGPHVFDFSFTKIRGRPAFTFSFDAEFRNLVLDWIRTSAGVNAVQDCLFGYLPLGSGYEEQWELFEDSLRFGFGGVSYAHSQDGIATISITIVDHRHLRQTTLMLNLVLSALTVLQSQVVRRNARQELQFEACCKEEPYGHSVSGSICGDALTWLRRQGARMPQDESSHSLPDQVHQAMRFTWNYAAALRLQEYADYCMARVYRDGRFLLACFGDACDLGMCPGLYSAHDSFVQFSSHNLDSAAQQLTLLAGLAMICRLAREEMAHENLAAV